MNSYSVGISRRGPAHDPDVCYPVEAETWRDAMREAEDRFRREYPGVRHWTINVREANGITYNV